MVTTSVVDLDSLVKSVTDQVRRTRNWTPKRPRLEHPHLDMPTRMPHLFYQSFSDPPAAATATPDDRRRTAGDLTPQRAASQMPAKLIAT